MSVNLDNRIRSVIGQLFPKYDKDGSGALNASEVTGFFNEAFQRLGVNIVVDRQEALRSLQRFDSNFDGQVSRQELFVALKLLANRGGNSAQYQQQPIVYQPQNPYNAGYPQGNWPQNYNQWNAPQSQQYQQFPQTGYTQPNQYNPNPNPWPQQQYNPYQNNNNNNNAAAQYNSPKDIQVKQYIDTLFAKYDRDGSGFLDANELANVMNELLVNLNIPIQLNKQEAMAILREIDKTNDGRIQKPELFLCVRNLY